MQRSRRWRCWISMNGNRAVFRDRGESPIVDDQAELAAVADNRAQDNDDLM